MGCWYKTCGLTGLAIRDGEDVYGFVLEKNMNDTDRCYTTSFWKPLPVPFVSKYNDYGGGQDSDKFLDMILRFLELDVVELSQGENPYHEPPVSKGLDSLDEQKFFDLCHDNRLYLNRSFGGYPKVENSSWNSEEFKQAKQECPQIDFVFVRKDIVDRYVKEKTWKVYVGEGKGTTGWSNSYALVTAQELFPIVPSIVAKLQAKQKENAFYDVRDMLRMIEGTDAENLLCSLIACRADYRYSQIVRLSELFRMGVATEMLVKFFERMLLGSIIDSLMSSLRKNWSPAGHEGSQNDDYDECALIAQYVIDYANQRLKD